MINECYLANKYNILIADPIPTDDGQHFRPFDEVFGTHTTEEHRPSLGSKKGTMTEKEAGFRISGETARGYVECTDCGKPRCIYIKYNIWNIIIYKLLG